MKNYNTQQSYRPASLQPPLPRAGTTGLQGELKRDISINSILELCKIKISLFAALSAATGCILVKSDLTPEILIPMLGVFFLACGAGALNQYQDRNTDILMLRTKSRPIPSGRIDALHALRIASLLFMAGFSMLALAGNLIALGLGIFAVIWYNFIYTYLKRKTAFAAVPGAVVGVIPPAIGWVTGGGKITDYELLAVCFFFFMWQIPHFWLLLLSYGEDFKTAQLPSLNSVFRWNQLKKITFIWMCAAAVSSLLIPFYGISTSNIVNFLLTSVAVWLVWQGVKVYRQKGEKLTYPLAFKNINIYMILVILILNIGCLLYL